MKKKAIIEIIIGLIMIVSALITYIKYIYELTFISNTIGGILFLSDGIFQLLKHKKLPSICFLIESTTIELVFFTTVICKIFGIANFNFSGGMFFLHIINSILVILYYLFIEYKYANYKKELLFVSLFGITYLIFDYIRYLLLGKFVYGLFNKDIMNIFMAFIILIGAYILLFIN